MSGQVRIESKGTGLDTHIYQQTEHGEVELQGVTRATWSVSAGDGAKAEVELEWLPINVIGNLLQSRTWVVLPKGAPDVPDGFVALVDSKREYCFLHKYLSMKPGTLRDQHEATAAFLWKVCAALNSIKEFPEPERAIEDGGL